MTDIIHIPLNQLALWDGNVRKTDIHSGLDELTGSIKAHGLLQSLVVRKGKRGKFEIVAGQRRYLALKKLADNGDVAKDCGIPCSLANGSLNAGEISLAENVVRAPMHPADQFEAFRAVIDGGASVADVSARFGIAESVVTKRLKLGLLSPIILDAYRKGDIDLEAAQAFTVSDNHEAQERVLAELPDWSRDADAIRSALTVDEVATSDKRLNFVGIDAYTSAGGVIRQDLFSEDGEGYLQDPGLLDRLVREKLSMEVAPLSAEGWSWVDTVPGADYSYLAGFKRLRPERAELSEDDQSQLDRLSQEYDVLVDSDDADDDRLDDLNNRIDDLNNREFWPTETLAIAGAIITLGYNGEFEIVRGLVRKQDVHKLSADTRETKKAAADASRPQGLSSRLVEDLTAQESLAIGAELLSRPDVALACVVHALLLNTLYHGHGTESCLKLRCSPTRLAGFLDNPDESSALGYVDRERERLFKSLPQSPDNLFEALLGSTREELLALLTCVAAMSVDSVLRKTDASRSSRLDHAQLVKQALQLDMTKWFEPTAGGYFSRIGRAQILAAVDEATGSHAPALEKLKKAELAFRAEALVGGSGWLPLVLRSNTQKIPAI